jgi:hypothetical protein
VKPTRPMMGSRGAAINDDTGLEREADMIRAPTAAAASPNGVVVQGGGEQRHLQGR